MGAYVAQEGQRDEVLCSGGELEVNHEPFGFLLV